MIENAKYNVTLHVNQNEKYFTFHFHYFTLHFHRINQNLNVTINTTSLSITTTKYFLSVSDIVSRISIILV